MKTEAGDLPLIAVGGGAFLVPDRVAGISEVIRVPHGDCANAVAAGADRASLATVDVEDMPLAYRPGNALRVRVRVAGEMTAPAPAQPETSPATL